MPGPIELQFDGRLSNVAIGYTNEEFIADRLLEPVAVAKKTGKYKKYNRPERFTIPNTLVGPKAIPAEIDWGTTEDTFTCDDYGLEEYLTQEAIDNAETPIQAETNTINTLMMLIGADKEVQAHAAVFNASNYAAGNQADENGTWATLSTDVLTRLEAGVDACVLRPNVLVMDPPTWRKVSRNDKILAAIKGTLNPQNIKGGSTAQPVVQQNELATFLGLEKVLVGWARYNTAKQGQTETLSRIWTGVNAGKGAAALLRLKSGAILDDVVSMAQLRWKDRQVLTSQSVRGAFGSKAIRVVESRVFKVVSTDCGYLFVDTLVT